MEGAANVGSEMNRVHIAEKNKQMADMLKVRIITATGSTKTRESVAKMYILLCFTMFAVQRESFANARDRTFCE